MVLKFLLILNKELYVFIFHWFPPIVQPTVPSIMATMKADNRECWWEHRAAMKLIGIPSGYVKCFSDFGELLSNICKRNSGITYNPSLPFLHVYPQSVCSCSPKDIFIESKWYCMHYSSKLETIQMSINSKTDKHILAHAYRIPHIIETTQQYEWISQLNFEW